MWNRPAPALSNGRVRHDLRPAPDLPLRGERRNQGTPVIRKPDESEIYVRVRGFRSFDA